MLKVLGFYYAHWRGEYVLRLIGDRFGPVYRVTPTRKLITGTDLGGDEARRFLDPT